MNAPVAARLPPFDLDAEAAVISAAFLDANAYPLVADRLPAHRFYSQPNRRIWEAMGALSSEGRPIDIVTVGGRLRDDDRMNQVGGTAYLAELIDAVPAVANLEEYAERVLALGRVRELIATCQRIAAEGYGDVGDSQAFIDQAENAVFQIAHTEQRRGTVWLSEATKESWDNIRAAAERRGKAEYPTGLDRLDYKLALRRQEVTVIAARPGMGKTSLVLQIAVHLAERGLVTQLFELEMPRDQLATRMACQKAEIDLHRVLQGFIRTDEWSVLTAAKSFLAKLPIAIDDTPGATLLHMRAESRTTRVKAGRLDLVIGDYLQLMSTLDQRSDDNRQEEISTNMRGLKRLARELDVPVIILAQLNREVEKRPDKRPQLSDLRDSGAIEQDADNVVFIYRPEYYQREKTAPQDRNVAELVIAKQRNGPTGIVRVHFDGPTTTFSNLQIEGDEEQQEQFRFDDNTPEANQ